MNCIPVIHSENGQGSIPLPHTKMHVLSRLRLTRFPSTRLIFHTTENILRVDLSCLGG